MSTSHPPVGPRTIQLDGVWLVLVAVLVIGGAAAGLSSTVRHQLALSFSRQTQPYVELFATPLDPTRLGTTCARNPRGRTAVTFGVTSHLQGAERLPYRVTSTVDPGGKSRQLDRKVARVRVAPGRTRTVTVGVRLPAGDAASVISVALPGTGQQLLLHCGTGS